jgi:hypothetical protein
MLIKVRLPGKRDLPDLPDLLAAVEDAIEGEAKAFPEGRTNTARRRRCESLLDAAPVRGKLVGGGAACPGQAEFSAELGVGAVPAVVFVHAGINDVDDDDVPETVGFPVDSQLVGAGGPGDILACKQVLLRCGGSRDPKHFGFERSGHAGCKSPGS